MRSAPGDQVLAVYMLGSLGQYAREADEPYQALALMPLGVGETSDSRAYGPGRTAA
jgi:hypothetical protein